MELLSVIDVLRRRWVLVAAGGIVAILVGALTSGALGIGPTAGEDRSSAVASARIVIDTARPLAADLGASDATIDTQAVLLAESLADAAQQAALARSARVPRSMLTVLTEGSSPAKLSALGLAAEQVGRESATSLTLRVQSNPEVPIITVSASAPDRWTAARLAAAVEPVIESLAAARAPNQKRRLTAEQLGGVRVAGVTDAGPPPAVGVFASVAVFMAWCFCLVVAVGLARGWRRTSAG